MVCCNSSIVGVASGFVPGVALRAFAKNSDSRDQRAQRRRGDFIF